MVVATGGLFRKTKSDAPQSIKPGSPTSTKPAHGPSGVPPLLPTFACNQVSGLNRRSGRPWVHSPPYRPGTHRDASL